MQWATLLEALADKLLGIEATQHTAAAECAKLSGERFTCWIWLDPGSRPDSVNVTSSSTPCALRKLCAQTSELTLARLGE